MKVPEEVKAAHPHLAEFWPYMELLSKESPRGKVLISSGFLEERLKEILLSYMLENDKANELVEEANAPLGTFSARITACFVLGLISQREHDDLVLVRKVRNAFAHDIHTSFQTRSVIDRCKALQHKAPDYVHSEIGEVRMSPSAQFETAAIALIMNLMNRPHYVSKRRCNAGDWPY